MMNITSFYLNISMYVRYHLLNNSMGEIMSIIIWLIHKY